MKKILIVDDSALIRKILKDIIEQEKDLELVGYARDGDDALKKIQELKPHVITLDLMMPGTSGLDVLKIIMKEAPKPVLIITSLAKKDSTIAMKALDLGAVDVLAKPENLHIRENFLKFQEELIEKIRTLSKSRPREPSSVKKKIIHKFPENFGGKKILIIGASTGGPSTLHRLFSNLPGNLPFPILIVQHMPEGFTKILAEHLDRVSEFKVKEAENGEPLKNNIAYISPADFHMKLARNDNQVAIELTKEEKVNNVRPSLDVLIESSIKLYGNNAVIVVLTGMGKDGTNGAKLAKDCGGKVIAESSESCILYGMPKSIVENNLADVVVDIEHMPVSIIQIIEG